MLPNQKGQALIIVLLLTTLIFLVGGAVVAMGTAVKKNSTREVFLTKAYYIAEAGVERALARLETDPLWRDQTGNGLAADYGGGRIESVVVEDDAQQGEIGKIVRITSTGTYSSFRRVLVVKVQVISAYDLFYGVSILPEEGTTDVTVTGNIYIGEEGGELPNIVVKGSLTVQSNAVEIVGNVFASGYIDDAHNKIDDSREHAYYTPIPPFPELPSEEWYRAAQVFDGDTVIGEPKGQGGGQQPDFNIAALQEGGIYFVDGDLTIYGTYSVPATIVATGDITVGRGSNHELKREDENGDYLLTLVALGTKSGSYGDVEIGSDNPKNNPNVEAIIIAKGVFRLRGNATLLGGVVAQDVASGRGSVSEKVSGTTTIIVDPELVRENLHQEIVENYSNVLEVRSWREG